MESKKLGRGGFEDGALVAIFKVLRKKSVTVLSGDSLKTLARKVIKGLGHVMTRNTAQWKVNKPV